MKFSTGTMPDHVLIDVDRLSGNSLASLTIDVFGT